VKILINGEEKLSLLHRGDEGLDKCGISNNYEEKNIV